VRDPFALLDLERSWALTASQIRTAQRRRAVAAHPDRQTDAARRDEAVSEAARINEAAAALLDPLSRGQALLELSAPSPRPPEPASDAAFLRLVLSLRESIDGAVTADDRRAAAAEVRDALAAAESDTAASMAAMLAHPDCATWSAAAAALARVRALRRAQAECEAWT
jgi:DnaJ-domain-containing protein 1